MAEPASPSQSQDLESFPHVYYELSRHMTPDSRFHYDISLFTPDFRGSSIAVDRLVQLPSYKRATTILATSDNSLEELRYRALREGKKVLVGTYKLRRGFVLLEPGRLSENQFRLASWLDGMERPGIGRPVSLVQMQDEGVTVDLCVIGGLVFNARGIVLSGGPSLFDLQWAILLDMRILSLDTGVVAVAHECQVVDDAHQELSKEDLALFQCDSIVTPERLLEMRNAIKPSGPLQLDRYDAKMRDNVQPLQELAGIRIMDDILKKADFGKASQSNELAKQAPRPDVDEQLGMSIVDKLMRNLRS